VEVFYTRNDGQIQNGKREIVETFRAYLSEIGTEVWVAPFFGEFVSASENKKQSIRLVRAFPSDACSALKVPSVFSTADSTDTSTVDSKTMDSSTMDSSTMDSSTMDGSTPTIDATKSRDASKSNDYYSGTAVLVTRGDCYFSEKIIHAQNAGAKFVFVANDGLGGFFKMGLVSDLVGGSGEPLLGQITTPSVSISHRPHSAD
jgi:hypothetical protein